MRLSAVLRQHIFPVLLLIFLAFAWRATLNPGWQFPFWYDQARDGSIVHEMVTQADLKLQGPSASGTGDAVYHGVLFYYFLAPFYALSADPRWPVMGLAMLTALSVVPMYGLMWNLTQKRNLAFAGGLLMGLTVEAAQVGTWLSNPALATVAIPFFWWFVWRVYGMGRRNEAWIVALWLGLSIQSVVFAGYLLLPLFLVFLLDWRGWFTRAGMGELIKGIAVLLLTVSTMLATQFLLWYRGIWHIASSGGEMTAWPAVLQAQLLATLQNIQWFFFPPLKWLGLFFSALALWFVWRGTTKKVKIFLFLWLLSPLSLLLLRHLGGYHTLVGLTGALTAATLLALRRSSPRSLILAMVFWMVGQLWFFDAQVSGKHHVAVQDGTTLDEKIQLVDSVLENESPVTYSVLTSPYKYNTTWAYLFWWRSRVRGREQPLFVGAPQAGLPGAALQAESPLPAVRHYAILDLPLAFPETLKEDFLAEQPVERLQEERRFGSLRVREYLSY